MNISQLIQFEPNFGNPEFPPNLARASGSPGEEVNFFILSSLFLSQPLFSVVSTAALRAADVEAEREERDRRSPGMGFYLVYVRMFWTPHPRMGKGSRREGWCFGSDPFLLASARA